MSDSNTKNPEPADKLLAQLTEEQKKLLSQAIELVTQRVFADATKRLRNYLLVAAAVVTLFGAVSVVGMKTAIKDATVGALREDSQLRQAIKDDALAKVTETEELLRKIEGALEDARNKQITTGSAMLRDLEVLLKQARAKVEEDNLLFERSARELHRLVLELKQRVEAAKSTE